MSSSFILDISEHFLLHSNSGCFNDASKLIFSNSLERAVQNHLVVVTRLLPDRNVPVNRISFFFVNSKNIENDDMEKHYEETLLSL